ncbi:MAG: PAS domain-containing protein [Balneolales bacterium]
MIPSQITSVFKVSPFPSLILRPDFTVAEVNQAYLQIADLTEAKMIGKGLLEMLDENSSGGSKGMLSELKHSLEHVVETKKPHEMNVQKYNLPANGSDWADTKYWILKNTPVLNETGDVDFILHTVTDVTEQKLLEKQKNDSQQLVDKAYKLANIGTWEYDMLSEKLHWSSLTKDIHGFDEHYEPDVKSTISLFKEGFNRNTFSQAANDAIQKEIPFNVELKMISGKGDERWVRATGEPEYNNGICTRFYGISQDVSSRRKAEEKRKKIYN